jgi:hypothetical protein
MFCLVVHHGTARVVTDRVCDAGDRVMVLSHGVVGVGHGRGHCDGGQHREILEPLAERLKSRQPVATPGPGETRISIPLPVQRQ